MNLGGRDVPKNGFWPFFLTPRSIRVHFNHRAIQTHRLDLDMHELSMLQLFKILSSTQLLDQ